MVVNTKGLGLGTGYNNCNGTTMMSNGMVVNNGGVTSSAFGTGMTTSPVDQALIGSAFGTALLAGTDEDQVVDRNIPIEFHIGIKDTSASITTDGQGAVIIFNLPGKFLIQFTSTVVTDQSQEVMTTFNSGSIPSTLKTLYEKHVTTIAGREQSLANSTILIANQGTTMTVRVFVNPATTSTNVPVTVQAGARLIIHGLADRSTF